MCVFGCCDGFYLMFPTHDLFVSYLSEVTYSMLNLDVSKWCDSIYLGV